MSLSLSSTSARIAELCSNPTVRTISELYGYYTALTELKARELRNKVASGLGNPELLSDDSEVQGQVDAMGYLAFEDLEEHIKAINIPDEEALSFLVDVTRMTKYMSEMDAECPTACVELEAIKDQMTMKYPEVYAGLE